MFFLAAMASSALFVTSPDKSIRFELSSDGAHYSVARKGEDIVAPSPLGLVFAKDAPYSALRTVKVRKESHSQTMTLVATKADKTTNDYNELVVAYRETSGLHRRMTIDVRAYNDGVAFRYVLPGGASYDVKGEATAFLLPNDADCVVSEFTPPHEANWVDARLSQLKPDKLYDMPMACASTSGRTHFAIAQSDLVGYTGAGLDPVAGGLHVHLSPLPKDPDGVAVRATGGLSTAWRVVMMGDRAGDLIPSELIDNLAPQATGDFSWVVPGKVAWDWWSGPTAGEKPTMARYERFIDFAAASGFPYFLIDAGWNWGAAKCCGLASTDITRPDPAIDMPALVKYAADRHVGLILWTHWRDIEPRVGEVLDTYKKWGIKGVKVDYMERDDHQMVDFYNRMAEATAQRHLLLDLHGAYPPAGLHRTYPNFITQEGVLGAEYNKFSKRVTPGHNVRLAYTRMLIGPMDYTPGGFRNGTPDTYAVHDPLPMTQSTRGQALGMYVVFESPLQMVSDDPDTYANAPGFDFLKIVPTAWDETRFVGGTPDTYVAVARRKGNTWYVGAMNTEEGRTADLPLDFLGGGTYTVRQWADGEDPNSVVETTATVKASDHLTLKMSGSGGGAFVLTPVQ